ncbi:hypothetical protein J3E69DRAFT_380051 [Trichoderma sp. SZMC 28015]
MGGFNPERDIPPLSGKVCLVTGANSGLGEAAVTAFAQHNPKKIYLAARSQTRAEEAIERIKASSAVARSANIEFLELDLASLESVKKAAARINAEADRLDILHLNAGVASVPASLTKEGYEVHFGTNYLGHALLTQLLLPKLLETAALPNADVRIISVSSSYHRLEGTSDGISFNKLKTTMEGTGGVVLYAQATLAKVLFARELARRYPNITTLSMHPGIVRTEIWKGKKDASLLMRTFLRPLVSLIGVAPEEGVKTQLWCTVSKDVKNGAYYEPIGKANMRGKFTEDDELASELWSWTDKELLVHGAPGWVKA